MKTTEFPHRKIWRITYPVLISLLMEHLIGMTDTAFMGHVGEVELGASAIAGIYYMVLYMLGFGFSVGAEILMGRRNGEGQYRSIGNIFFQGSAILMMIAAAVTLLSYTVSPVLLRNILSSPAIYGATMDYINLRIWGLFFSLIACMFRAFYMATTRTSILTLNGIVMVLSNVVLNYIFVFGKLGLPAMGIAGAAIDCRGVYLRRLLRTLYPPADGLQTLRHVPFHAPLAADTATDIPCFGLDDRTVFHLVGYVALLLPCHRAPRRTAARRIEHRTERIGILLHVRIGFRFDRNGHRQQSDGQRQTAGGHARLLPHHADVRGGHPAAVPARHGLPGAHHAHLHRQCRPDSRRRTLHARHAAHLHPQRAGLRPLPRRIGNRQYAPGIPDGARLNDVIYICIIAVRLRSDIALCWTSDAVYALGLLVLSYLYLKRADWQSKRI